MPTQVQLRRGTQAQNNSFTGAQAEMTVDTDNFVIRLHDGINPGGRQVAMASATQTLTNKTLSSPIITSPVLSGGTINNTPIGLTTPAAGQFTTLTTTGLCTVDSLVVNNQIQIGATQITGALILSPNTLTSGGNSAVTNNLAQDIGWDFRWGLDVAPYILSYVGNGSTTVTINLAGGQTTTTLGIKVGDTITLSNTGVSTMNGTWTVSNAAPGTTSFAVATNSAVPSGSYADPIADTAILDKRGFFGYIYGSKVFSIIPDASSSIPNSKVASGELGNARFGDLALNGSYGNTPNLTSTNTAFNLLNTTVTTLNIGGAATQINLGNATNATLLTRPGTIVGSNTTQNLWNTVATTVNAFGAATSLNLGASSGTTTVNNNLVVTGNLTINGTTTTVNNETVVNTITVSNFDDTIRSRKTFTGTTSGSTATPIVTFATATYRSGIVEVQVVNGTAYRILSMLWVHDGTNVTLSENYAVGTEIQTGNTNTSFSASISSGTLTLYATCSSGTAVIKGEATSFKV